MFTIWQLLTMVFVLFGLSTFVILIVIRFNRKRIEHAGELDQKDVEKALAVKQKAFETQEAERKRIGEDLHDDIGPKLGILKMQLEMVGMKHPEVKDTIKPVVKELIGTMKHVRKVSHDLVPQILYEVGLEASIKHISKQLNEMPDLHSTAVINHDLPKMDKKKELVIYRVVQEGVNNALKHAEASSIDIQIDIVDHTLMAKVIDNGVGLKDKAGKGLGLSSMRERAEVFDGSVSVQNGAQNGTEVELILPI